MRTALTTFALAAAMFAAAPASAATPTDTVTARDSTRTVVEVRNQAFHDAVIYAVRDGFSYRLGIAVGNTTSKFTVPRFMNHGLYAISFVIDPIGPRGYTRSDEIVVSPGDIVELTIPPR